MDSEQPNDYFALNKINMYSNVEIFLHKEVSLFKKITEQDVNTFIQLSGDNNPIHHDELFAKKTIFKEKIAHGLLAIGLISSGLTKLMGPGNVWLSYNFDFQKPIRIGDTIRAVLKIVEIEKNSVCLIETTCSNQKNEIIVKGIARSRLFAINKKNSDKV